MQKRGIEFMSVYYSLLFLKRWWDEPSQVWGGSEWVRKEREKEAREVQRVPVYACRRRKESAERKREKERLLFYVFILFMFYIIPYMASHGEEERVRGGVRYYIIIITYIYNYDICKSSCLSSLRAKRGEFPLIHICGCREGPEVVVWFLPTSCPPESALPPPIKSEEACSCCHYIPLLPSFEVRLCIYVAYIFHRPPESAKICWAEKRPPCFLHCPMRRQRREQRHELQVQTYLLIVIHLY